MKMKVSGKKVLNIFILIIIINNIFTIPKVFAPPPPSPPDQFISEIFPNSTLPLKLINSDITITFNATDLPNKINIQFEANYTINYAENSTDVSFILPLSLDINMSQSIIEVYVNNTQIPHSLFRISNWNETLTAIDTNPPWFTERYPINFIKTNVTLIKNSTSMIGYYIHTKVFNPLDSIDPFYMIYHIGTSQEWIGNTSGRVELRAYGKQPVFSIGGSAFSPEYELVDINGGTVFICLWNNSQVPDGFIGVTYYGPSDDGFLIIIIINISASIGIAIIIILVILIRKNRRRIITVF
ncbi:MAG: hypothetical protein ACFFA4_08655 [Promethearchaeota archaeon]